MQQHRHLHVPDGLQDVCDPERLALIVYDMQVGVVRQIADGPQATARVVQVLDAARRAGVRVFFTRHMSLPVELMGVSQLRTDGLAAQGSGRGGRLAIPARLGWIRARAGARSARLGGSLRQALDVGSRGHPARVRAARRPGDRLRDRRRGDGGRPRADRSPRRRPRPHPRRSHRRLRAENQAAAKRSLDALATAGDALLTDVSTITALLAPAAVTGPQLNRKLTRAIERNRNVRQYRSRWAVEDQHMSVDSVGSKPTRVLIVVANPATATTVGWPTRFWGAELTHPEGRSNGK